MKQYENIQDIYEKDTNILVQPVAGDTDSVAGDTIIYADLNDVTGKTIATIFNESPEDGSMITQHGAELRKCNQTVLNWSGTQIVPTKIKYISRHKVSKSKWILKTKSGKHVICTHDHSLIVFRDGKKLAVKPYEICKTDKVLILVELKPLFDEIESCTCIGNFDDEYVYDIEVEDDTHTFIANDILVHNSIYFCWEGLLNTIEGIENMSISEKVSIIEKICSEFLNQHNREIMTEYYRGRNMRNPDTDMIHEFELETIAYSEIRMDVKKRYAQLLAWKDGKVYDVDDMPIKTKGLEMIKSSVPKAAREALKRLTKFLLENDDPHMLQLLNIEMQKEKQAYMVAPLEDICGSIGVQNYTKYIVDDNNPNGLVVAPKCPFNCRALGNYNQIRQTNKLPGEPIYGGKMRWYLFYPGGVRTRKNAKPDYFAFRASEYPEWASKYAPVSRVDMFEHFVIDPFNRMLEAARIGILKMDGSIQSSLLF